ncbi:helix-turn-helix domain-containing protein [Streptomyces sp. NPDC096040]|uniref:helix-turn-helix domain-containing protein n=1 Tax=Streptomyces sp. NPDC096040 TaxID=3155541 RepID=UPI0033298840
MTRIDPAKRVDAILPLVAGQSQRAVAESVGVHPSTVRGWLKDPLFTKELARVQEVAARRPLDAEAVLAVMDEVAVRLGARSAGGPVVVSIPAGASAGRRRRLLARGIARAVEGGLR